MIQQKLNEIEAHWTDVAESVLKGRTIAYARYMSRVEATHLGFGERSLVIVLDNGVMLFPSRDDEGNGAGALFTTDLNHPTFPTLP